MRNMNGRLERMESRIQHDTGAPVVFVQSAAEIDERTDIGAHTIVFIDDIPAEEE